MLPTNDPILKEIYQRLMAALPAKRIYLFGSRAKGTATKHSDYDILVVVPNSVTDKSERHFLASNALDEMDVSVDCFVYTEKEFDEKVDDFSSLPELAINTGFELHG